LAPNAAAFKAGQKLAAANQWLVLANSDRSLWGEIKGSGKDAYKVAVDTHELAYKCTCPSRQFPCKHGIGLMLLYTNNVAAFKQPTEPDYLAEWLNKRQTKAEKQEIAPELSEEQTEQKNQLKAKRDEGRNAYMAAGVDELMLWLKDLLRIGLLDLPNKTPIFYENLAARMVDAKAPGLAVWVKAFLKLDFTDRDQWQQDALALIAKIFLLLRASQEIDQQDAEMQKTLRAMLGVTIQTKDLFADPETICQKDEWLVLAVISEALEDLTIVRTWLYGLNSQKSALHLAFETKFSDASAVKFIEGTVLQAEMAFYPDALPHRVALKQQNRTLATFSQKPVLLEHWLQYHEKKVKMLQQNPWLTLYACWVSQVLVLGNEGNWILVDTQQNFMPLSKDFVTEKILKLLIMSNGNRVDIAFVEKKDGILPLGIFTETKYLVL
jgi:hypothetical protein